VIDVPIIADGLCVVKHFLGDHGDYKKPFHQAAHKSQPYIFRRNQAARKRRPYIFING
jgi:hypothetical protein